MSSIVHFEIPVDDLQRARLLVLGIAIGLDRQVRHKVANPALQ